MKDKVIFIGNSNHEKAYIVGNATNEIMPNGLIAKVEVKMKDKLLPCPFCGGEDLIIEVLSSRTDILTNYHACIVDTRCDNCHTLKSATVYGIDENDCIKEAIRLWNRRVENERDNIRLR